MLWIYRPIFYAIMIKWALQDNQFGLDNHLRAFESLKTSGWWMKKICKQISNYHVLTPWKNVNIMWFLVSGNEPYKVKIKLYVVVLNGFMLKWLQTDYLKIYQTWWLKIILIFL